LYDIYDNFAELCEALLTLCDGIDIYQFNQLQIKRSVELRKPKRLATSVPLQMMANEILPPPSLSTTVSSLGDTVASTPILVGAESLKSTDDPLTEDTIVNMLTSFADCLRDDGTLNHLSANARAEEILGRPLTSDQWFKVLDVFVTHRSAMTALHGIEAGNALGIDQSGLSSGSSSGSDNDSDAR
jgi:hypothetical protein